MRYPWPRDGPILLSSNDFIGTSATVKWSPSTDAADHDFLPGAAMQYGTVAPGTRRGRSYNPAADDSMHGDSGHLAAVPWVPSYVSK